MTTPNPPRLSPLELLAGKHVLLIGTTGFLAKLVLSMLVERFSIRRLYVLIRSTPSMSGAHRFRTEVLTSEVLAPLRTLFGDAFDAYVENQIEVVEGDISKPNLGIHEDLLPRLRQDLDVVINSAGLVTFNPPLEQALDVNTVGALEVARFAASLKSPRLVHVSTCFVAGARSGRIREDAPILGSFPKQDVYKDVEFDWTRELKDLSKATEQVKARTDDAALEARFKQEAFERLKKEGREPHERTVKAAVTHQRRRWVQEELIRVGIERAQYWGWTNIYTFTKALGEQAIAATPGLDWAIVRPAIVESSASYPFPGWNEGMNTSAPLAYLGLRGHSAFPATNDLILDIIPVDYVSSAIIAAAAALFAGETKKVYQAATGDINPCSMARVVTLVGLRRRRKIRADREAKKVSWLSSMFNERKLPLPVHRKHYELLSAPTAKAAIGKAREVLNEMDPERYGPFGEALSLLKKKTKDLETQVSTITDIFDMFMPFIWENKYVFRTAQTRSLFARMNEADRKLLPFDPEGIDWRHYWLDVHMPGLEKWVLPKLDEAGPKRVPIPRDYRDLAELFESRTVEHGRRVAFRVLNEEDVADSFTYRDVRRSAHGVAQFLARQGVARGDRVMLASEARPEWGIAYFGVILAGATVVPVDIDLSDNELWNIARAAQAKAALTSTKLKKRLLASATTTATTVSDASVVVAAGKAAPSADAASATGAAAPLFDFDEVFRDAHLTDPEETKIARRAEDVASIIFTSGTTGRPKGVMLTDRNFTALTARMSALFELRRTDALLSVLPLHHTFEFSVGLLLPLASGASVTYLEDRTSELLTRAFEETPVTSLVGVPAVWESLHRKLTNEIAARGRVAEFVVRWLMRANAALRDKWGLNIGRLLFRPAHDALGGNVRYMVSGGAPLRPAIFKDLRGLGFNLHEGYGLTEASPVLTVGWPRAKTPVGSVGWPLPGIEVRIRDADGGGIGEIVARGPTIMKGYLDNAEATSETVVDGWLQTGDRGRLDDDGHLFIVGREKDVIIDSNGKNVYPDEIEELYRDCIYIKELSVVGVPSEDGHGERVAALVVANYEVEDKEADASEGVLPKEEVRARIREHFRNVGSKQTFARRVKTMHFWEGDLPRTATKKIKRPFVREQIQRIEATLKKVRSEPSAETMDLGLDHSELSIRRSIASIAQKKVAEIAPSTGLVDQLGFDSLMQLELLTTLETEFPRAKITPEELSSATTVADVVRLASRDSQGERQRVEVVGDKEEPRPFRVPYPVAEAGKKALGWLQRVAYDQLLDVKVEGRGNIPANRNMIVATNHASHLDMGLVKNALGDLGGDLATLAAKDYFFDDPIRRLYFENFTNLLPIDRHGSLKKSLRLASAALRRGQSLLIFPEGTRSRNGVMTEFKPAIGHLCLHERVDILPMYLGGTHEALPVGAVVPASKKLFARIGPPLTADQMLKETHGMPRARAYRFVAAEVERAVRRLAESSKEEA
ncbi:MAG: AMP-binding protein [Deltaproteobacteria bacterium]|nr:AMP-binding protein [Deltaproteobacteria bacterium]